MPILSHRSTLLIMLLATLAVVTCAMAIPTAVAASQPHQGVVPQCLYYFYSEGCHSCEVADAYLHQVEAQFPTLTVHRFEVHNSTNWELMVDLYNFHNITMYITPVAFIGNEVLSGAVNIQNNLEPLLLNNTGWQCPSTNSTIPPYIPTSPPIVIILTMAIADSLNPCAIAVLLLLLVAISASGSVLKTGGSYIAGNFVAYLLIGFGLFALLRQFQLPYYMSKVIGVLAIAVAVYSLFSKIPTSQKPRVKKLIEGATSPPAAFLAGALISAIELPCTGGPYFLALTLISQYQLNQLQVLGYLIIYNLIFILPLVAILVLYKLARTPKIPKDYLRYASAIAMLIVGIYLIII